MTASTLPRGPRSAKTRAKSAAKTRRPPVEETTVTGIRGVERVALNVERRPVVIGGLNGSGKTFFATGRRCAIAREVGL